VARLAIYFGGALDRESDLTDAPVRLGRGDQNDIVLPDETKSVSREHAELRYENVRYVLTDLNSGNGLWVGDERLATVMLAPDVPVTLGPYTLILRDAAAPAPPVEEPAYAPRQLARPPSRPPEPAPRSSRRDAVPVARPVMARRPLMTRLTRPMVAGGFAVIVLVLIAMAFTIEGRSPEPVTTSVPGTSVPDIPGSHNDDLRSHLDAARAALDRGQVDLARDEVNRILSVDPVNPDARRIAQDVEEAERRRLAGLNAPAPPAGGGGPVRRVPAPIDRGVTPPAGDSDTGKRFAQAQESIDRGQYEDALRVYEELYRRPADAASAADRIAQLALRMVTSSMADGHRLERGADWVQAQGPFDTANKWLGILRRYAAAQLSPAQASDVADALRAIHDRRLKEGGDALKTARQLESAISAPGFLEKTRAEYQKAYRLLPDDDAGKAEAKKWLDAHQ